MADSAVNLLRTDAGRDPYDRGISDLVGELSNRSEEFRVRWAKHNVRLHYTGTKRFHHPVVGGLEVGYETMPLPRRPRPGPHRLQPRARQPLGRRPRAARVVERLTLAGPVGDSVSGAGAG